MKIALLGANGRTGREIINHARGNDIHVTAIVRDESSLSDLSSDNITIIPCDVLNTDSLGAAIKGHDVVISTLGPRGMSDQACRIYSDSAKSVAAAMQANGQKRLLIVSTALLFPPKRMLDHVLRRIARNNFNHAQAMENTYQSADLDWTFARVGFLNSKPDDAYQATPDGFQGGGISRSALANYLLTEASEGAHKRKIVGLSQAG